MKNRFEINTKIDVNCKHSKFALNHTFTQFH